MSQWLTRAGLGVERWTSVIRGQSFHAMAARASFTYGQGIVIVDSVAGHVRRIRHDPIRPSSLHSAEKEAVEALCLRVVDSLVSEIKYKGAGSKTSASIGIAIFPDNGDNQESLYNAADLALYDAKRSGRNTWRWHAPGIISPVTNS